MSKRKIIRIDEDKCNGCGLCIPNCAEGALKIINGKARLVSETLCDGLGACLGHCPEGAIHIEEREAKGFDETKVIKNEHHHHDGASCPGARVVDNRRDYMGNIRENKLARAAHSELRQWPVQIKLVPPTAPYLKDSDILVAADCVPFAYANFHEDLLKGKVLLVGCPKLDDIDLYKEKITQMLKLNSVRSVTYAHMEVPCCSGLVAAIEEAISASGKKIPFKEAVVSIKGEIVK
jgi:NAD-dependent dihydropyrimidine dehydrogenase PreA subunit